MIVSELISKLQELQETYGDLIVEIDIDRISSTLSIEQVDVGNSYIGKINYIYIYPDDNDVEEALDDYEDYVREEIRNQI